MFYALQESALKVPLPQPGGLEPQLALNSCSLNKYVPPPFSLGATLAGSERTCVGTCTRDLRPEPGHMDAYPPKSSAAAFEGGIVPHPTARVPGLTSVQRQQNSQVLSTQICDCTGMDTSQNLQ